MNNYYIENTMTTQVTVLNWYTGDFKIIVKKSIKRI